MARNPVWFQEDYQFYNDDGAMGAASTLAALNTPASVNDTRTQAFRLRMDFGDSNNATQNNVRSVKLQVSVNGGAYADVTTTGKVIETVDASGIADGANDPNQRLTPVAGSVFQTAWVEFDENNVTTSRTWADTYTEYEFCLKLNAAAIGDQFTFRIVTSSNEVPTITNTATLNVIAEPTFVGYTHAMIF